MKDEYLSKVQKPSRYVGGEANMVIKQKDSVDLRVAFCFPDTYEIGMSHLGLRILYGIMNELDYVWCERAFAPWLDMEKFHKQDADFPLYALESGDPLNVFDVLAFTLQYELCYSNVLNMLALSNIPLRSCERNESHPLIIAGGPCALNPEPMANFIDLFVVGEGEEVIVELTELFRFAKVNKLSRMQMLEKACKIQGVYVPCFYTVEYNSDGTIKSFAPINDAPSIINKRIINDLDNSFFPTKLLVPNTEIIHERVMLELFRGCTRGCRFCQAGFTSRPLRSKNVETLIRQGIESCKNSGYEEIALTSLSTSDYMPNHPADCAAIQGNTCNEQALTNLCDGLLEYCEPKRIGLSLPSLRADSFSRELMERVQKVRKSGLTFAPEAGSARMRDVINKNLTEEHLFAACKTAFEGGWSGVKLYFMTGLPTETDEDLVGIADLSSRVYQLWRQSVPDKSRGVRISASTSCFVPKPHTPFQWEPQDSQQELERKTKLIKASMRKQISYNWHEPQVSYLEGVFARADRRIGDAIEIAFKNGARLDGWRECFKLDIWNDAFKQANIDPAFYANRRRSFDEILPWDFINIGVNRSFLQSEAEKSLSAVATPDCRSKCSGCGASSIVNNNAHDADGSNLRNGECSL